MAHEFVCKYSLSKLSPINHQGSLWGVDVNRIRSIFVFELTASNRSVNESFQIGMSLHFVLIK